MWIFHPLGFCSAVLDEIEPENLLIRGRIKGDLEKLFPGYKVKKTANRDYLFRISIPRIEAATRIAELLLDVEYDNFKNACPDDRHDPYMAIWSTMYNQQLRRNNGFIPKKKNKVKARRYNDYFDWRFDPSLDQEIVGDK